MKRTMQYSVGGQLVDVAHDRNDEFLNDVAANGDQAEAVTSFRVKGRDGAEDQIVPVKASRVEEFMADAKANGDAPEEVTNFTMSDGSTRAMTKTETAKFLRSKEYRESADYEAPKLGSVSWAALKGGVEGAVEGAYKGGKAAAGKVVAAIPEAIAGVSEAAGHLLGEKGTVHEALGNYLRDSGRGVKAWLDENVKSQVADELGYEDWSTKMSEVAGDVAGMSAKFAPAALTGGSTFMTTILASDGINAYANSFEAAKQNGATDGEANLAGLASGLINYYGNKLLMKTGGLAEGITNPLLKMIAGTGATSAAMGVQAAGNKGVENVIEGKPITEGMLGAGINAAIEGATFHGMNEISRGAKEVAKTAKETKALKEMRKEGLLAAAETPEGRDFLNKIVVNEGVDEAVKARREGRDVSRKMAIKADLPDNMSAEERNQVVDGIREARDVIAAENRAKVDPEQRHAVAQDVIQTVGGNKSREVYTRVLEKVAVGGDKSVLDDPEAREKLVNEAASEVFAAENVKMEQEKRRKEAKSINEVGEEIRGEEEMAARIEAQAKGMAEAKAEKEAKAEAEKKRVAEYEAKRAAEKKAQEEQDEYERQMLEREEARAKSADERLKAGEIVTPEEAAKLKKQGKRVPKSQIGEVEAPKTLENGPTSVPSEKGINARLKETEAPTKGNSVETPKMTKEEAQKVLKEKFYQPIEALEKELKATPAAGIKKRQALEAAIEYKKSLTGNKTGEVGNKKPENGNKAGENETKSYEALVAEERAAFEKVAELKDDYGPERNKANLDLWKKAKALKDFEAKNGIDRSKGVYADKSQEDIDKQIAGWEKAVKQDEERIGAIEPTNKGKKPEAVVSKTETAKENLGVGEKEAPFGQRVVLGRNKVTATVGKSLTKEQAEEIADALKNEGVRFPSVVNKGGKYSVSFFTSEDSDKVQSVLDKRNPKTKAELKKEADEVTANARRKAELRARDEFLKAHKAESDIVEKMGFSNSLQKKAVVDAMLDKPTEKHWEGALAIQGRKVLDFLKNNGVDVSTIKTPSDLRDALRAFKESKSAETKEAKKSQLPNKGKKAKDVEKVVSSKIKDFVASKSDVRNQSLWLPNHTPEGKVVASNGSILIETTRGFDKTKVGQNDKFPNYKQVIPGENKLTKSVEISPAMIAKAAKEAVTLAKGTKQALGGNDAIVAFKFGDRIAYASAKYLKNIAEIMDAEGINTIKWGGEGPLVARNENTTIVFMPLRGFPEKLLKISGHSGKVVESVKLVDMTDRIKELKDILSKKDISVGERVIVEKKLADAEKQQTLISRIKEQSLDEATAKKFLDPNDSTLAQIPLDENGRLDLHRIDPAKRADKKVVEWAKKNGLTVTKVDTGKVDKDGLKITEERVNPETLREYEAQQAKKASSAIKRWFPDMKITYHNYGEKIERGKEVIELRDKSGNTLGWFEPGTKDVHLLPGSNAETVAHEIMWHGTRQWASQEAAKGNEQAKALLRKMHDVEKNVPEDLKKKILRLYADNYAGRGEDAFLNEFGAFFTMGKGGAAIEREMAKAENRKWYSKALYTIKELYKDYMTAHGGNRVNLNKIGEMSREEFVDFLADAFAGGKALGEIGGTKAGTGERLSTEETAFQKAKRKIYDVNSAIEKMEKDIEEKIGRKLTEEESAAMANALTPGDREAANMDLNAKIKTYKEILARHGLDDSYVQYYMALKAAAGRDAKIDARNKAAIMDALGKAGMSAEGIEKALESYQSTNGSNIDPREAKMMIKELEAGDKAAGLEEARKFLRSVIDETLDLQAHYGLISEAEKLKWRAEEPDYIPFKNAIDAETGEVYGRGVNNFLKPEHFMAKGRQSSAGDITSHIFMDLQSTHQRGIETATRQKLARLVEKYAPELGEVTATGKLKASELEKSPNMIAFKRGGESYVLSLNGTRGEAIASGITERNTLRFSEKNVLSRAFASFSRGQAALATRLAPFFPGRNLLKDNIELANIVFSEKGLVGGVKWAKDYAVGQAKMAKTLGKYITTGEIDTSSDAGKLLDRYIKAGGLISGGATEGFAKIKDSLSPEAIQREIKRGNNKFAVAGKHLLKSIAYVNEMAELTTRVNAFYAETESGASDRAAALFSRRATVDFNRHGEWTGITNVARLFSNSTLGATARATAALTKSKAGMGVIAACFTSGLVQGFMEYYLNKDEDEKRRKMGGATGQDVSEYERRTSLFHFRKGDNFYKVAQHESPFALIGYLGDNVARLATGQIDGKTMAKNLGVSTAELAYAFTGLGNINLEARDGKIESSVKSALISGLAPSALQPALELMADIDYKGDKIFSARGAYETGPVSELGRRHTPDWAKETARGLNSLTGGNEGRAGVIDVHPETISKLVEGYGKNAAREVGEVVSVFKAIQTGELPKLDVRNVPMVRDVVRPLDGNDNRYFKALNAHRDDKHEWDTMRAKWSKEEQIAFNKAHPYAVSETKRQSLSRMETEITRLRKMEQGFKYVSGKPVPFERSEENVAKLKERRMKMQAKFIELMNQ